MDKISVCNMVLDLLSIPRITSFDDNSNQAQKCKLFFQTVAERVLRDHFWSFALTGCKIVESPEEVFDDDFLKVGILPTDLIRIVKVSGDQPYRRNGMRIYSDKFPLKLIYVRRELNPEAWDASFLEAFQNLLSCELSASITSDISKRDYYRKEYERILSLARTIDSQENRYQFNRKPNERFDFIKSRRH